MARLTMPKAKTESKPSSMIVVGGVDTHADTHTVAALDQLGRRLGWAVFPAHRAGYRALADWLAGHGGSVQSGLRAPAATALG